MATAPRHGILLCEGISIRCMRTDTTSWCSGLGLCAEQSGVLTSPAPLHTYTV